MWFMTPEGFYSAIQWSGKKGDPNNGLICIRTRTRGDLNRLRKWMPELSDTVVTPTGDYRYRAWLTHWEFGEGMRRISEAINYANFKTEVGKRDRQREHLYHRVWSILGSIQKDGPYGWERRRRRWQPLPGTLFDPDPDWGYPSDEEVGPLLDASFGGKGYPVRGYKRAGRWVRAHVRGQR